MNEMPNGLILGLILIINMLLIYYFMYLGAEYKSHVLILLIPLIIYFIFKVINVFKNRDKK